MRAALLLTLLDPVRVNALRAYQRDDGQGRYGANNFALQHICDILYIC